jgi:hypothetical protein
MTLQFLPPKVTARTAATMAFAVGAVLENGTMNLFFGRYCKKNHDKPFHQD